MSVSPNMCERLEYRLCDNYDEDIYSSVIDCVEKNPCGGVVIIDEAYNGSGYPHWEDPNPLIEHGELMFNDHTKLDNFMKAQWVASGALIYYGINNDKNGSLAIVLGLVSLPLFTGHMIYSMLNGNN